MNDVVGVVTSGLIGFGVGWWFWTPLKRMARRAWKKFHTPPAKETCPTTEQLLLWSKATDVWLKKDAATFNSTDAYVARAALDTYGMKCAVRLRIVSLELLRLRGISVPDEAQP